MQSAERSRAKRALQATTSTWCRVDTRKSDERLQRTVDVCGKVYQQVALTVVLVKVQGLTRA